MSVAVGYEIKQNSYTNVEDVIKIAENRMYRRKLTESMEFRNNAVNVLISVLSERHIEEKIHCERVSQLCKEIGIALNLRDDTLLELEQTGFVHDIGKISLSDEILHKSGKLTKEEYQTVKSHSEKGYQILKVADKYSNLAEYVLCHHEYWNGSGYPRGLKGNDIPLISRIVCIADAFESMTADRPYRRKREVMKAAREIIQLAGEQFDPRIARIFVEKVLKIDVSILH